MFLIQKETRFTQTVFDLEPPNNEQTFARSKNCLPQHIARTKHQQHRLSSELSYPPERFASNQALLYIHHSLTLRLTVFHTLSTFGLDLSRSATPQHSLWNLSQAMQDNNWLPEIPHTIYLNEGTATKFTAITQSTTSPNELICSTIDRTLDPKYLRH